QGQGRVENLDVDPVDGHRRDATLRIESGRVGLEVAGAHREPGRSGPQRGRELLEPQRRALDDVGVGRDQHRPAADQPAIRVLTASSQRVPAKKSGLPSAYRRAGLANMKSRKSVSLMAPRSTSSYASCTTPAMSVTSQWPMSDPNTACSREPKALMSV